MERWKKCRTKTPTKAARYLGHPLFLDEHKRLRDRALFDLAIDSKLRGCDLVKMKIGDVMSASQIRNCATVIQQKTGRPVQFEIMSEARRSMEAWLQRRGGTIHDFVFPSRVDYTGHLNTRQYARLVDDWVATIGLEQREHGTQGTPHRCKRRGVLHSAMRINTRSCLGQILHSITPFLSDGRSILAGQTATHQSGLDLKAVTKFNQLGNLAILYRDIQT